ncbi:hypothetical protein AB0I54_42200 [Streptomyces sp. NPDC050625]
MPDMRTDVYQDHPTPDVPQQDLNALDSAVDVLIAVSSLAENTDQV